MSLDVIVPFDQHRPNVEQGGYWRSEARFVFGISGRRSGKTEIGKRKQVKRALKHRGRRVGQFICAAPTFTQAGKIFWRDVKDFTRPFWSRPPVESKEDRHVSLTNGAEIHIVGLDKPERIEGVPIDSILIDEFGNTKPDTWDEHILPALDTPGRPGSAIITGVPEGRNHYFKLVETAERDIALLGDASEYAIFRWKSSDVLDAKTIENRRRTMDELSFRQEYEGEFVNYVGLAYYGFDRKLHANERERVLYNPRRPLIFCFDFNRAPGVAVVCQILDYHPLEPLHRPEVDRQIVAVIGEVHIPSGSTTPVVCRRLINDWGPPGKAHDGPVYIYGDATGGTKKSSSTEGSDWDLVRAEFRNVPGWEVKERIKKANPSERARVNAVNTKLRPVAAPIGILLDPKNARNTIEDFEAVKVLKGGSGELDKEADNKRFSHLSDGLGYFIEYEFPLADRRWVSHSL